MGSLQNSFQIYAVDYARRIHSTAVGLGLLGLLAKLERHANSVSDVKNLRDWETSYEKYEAFFAEAEISVANGGNKKITQNCV